MKISIITVCFQSAGTIRSCIESIAMQAYPDIEYIVIDGGSKDETLEILQEFSGTISKIVSEKDNGIYDAMNKGMGLATGDVIGFLNSDDVLAGPHVIDLIAEAFSKYNPDAVYGDLIYFKPESRDRVFRYWKSSAYNLNHYRKGWFPPHPSFYFKRSLFIRFGGFNLDLKIAADYEMMFRFLVKEMIRSVYLPEVIVRMSSGGASNGSISRILTGVSECAKAWKINGINPPLFLIPGTLLFRFLQLFRKALF